MKISPKIKIYLLILLTAAIVIVLVLFVVIPSQNKIKKISQDIYDQRVNFEFITQQRQDIVHLEREIKEIQSKQEKLSPTIFSRNDTLELITSLETIAQNNQLENQKLNLSNPTALDSEIMISTLKMDVTTYYDNLINWLSEIERQPFYIIIDSIDLKSTAGRLISNSESTIKDNPIMSVITAKVYWQ